VQAYDSETAAFEAFARSRPDNLILLIDTYDTEEAARKVVSLAPRLASAGVRVAGVRLDSGDLIALARSVRRILDAGGLREVTIFASGGIDEDELARAARQRAPIDGFGIGTSLTTSFDVPALDCAYKLQEYAGLPRRKRSTGKATWPGRKQVWRHYGPDGRIARDILSVEGDEQAGEPLIEPVMRGGRRLAPQPTLAEIRARAARSLARLPQSLRRLQPGASSPVEVADALERLAADVDRRLAEQARP
jgi:nicotinate phosphoribosyltransferase